MPTDELRQGYREHRRQFARDRDRRVRLAAVGQSPRVLWIGCSDSRVVPEMIVGAAPGDIFVVRNVANVIPPAGSGDCATAAAIEYAVRHLRVAHAVVCGHTDCGGIKAMRACLDRDCEPGIVGWLEHARPACATIEDTENIRANVLLQRQNLRSFACVQAARARSELTDHAWLYDLRSGEIQAWSDEARAWLPWDAEG